MSKYDFDLVVIGAGSGGISSAILGKNLGKRIAIVEKKKIGGECTWSGCVPSKALLKSAHVAQLTKDASQYGLSYNAGTNIDSAGVMDHVREIVHRVYQEEKPEVFEKIGIKVFIGTPKFTSSNHIKINGKQISSKYFIISTGSHSFVPPLEGLNEVEYLTNENLFQLKELPDSMIIVGGGPIGSEMASALNRLGVKVTVIEMTDHLLPREDDELATILTEHMVKEGVEVRCHSRAEKIMKVDNGLILQIKSEHKDANKIMAETILIAVGRRPNIEGLDLEKAGVEYTPRGIITDKRMRTSAKNIYAIGDVVGPYQFSHMAEYWASIAVPNALLPLPIKKKANHDNIPWATFTEPELARSGLTEKEAKEKYGTNVLTYKYPYSKIDRAKTDLAETGMAKIILSPNGKILGIHILGDHAADLMHELLLAKKFGIKFHKIQSMIHTYPTYGDLLKRLSAQFYADKLRNNFFVKLLHK